MSLNPGFDCSEACDLLTLCAIIEGGSIKPPPPTPPPVPTPPNGWKQLFDSKEILPFENKWQLWRKGENGPFAIIIRGTTLEKLSILEDLLFLMINGSGELQIPYFDPLNYKFTIDPRAAVHLGFALGALFLFDPPSIFKNSGISEVLKDHNVSSGDDIFIAGHSQGAAVGTLLRSLLHYSDQFSSYSSIKSYFFAQPKPGNDHFATEFEHLFCIPRMAFRITNSLDWVPQAPLTLEFLQDFNSPNPISTGHISKETLESDPLTSFLNDMQTNAFSHLEEKAKASILSKILFHLQKNPETKGITLEKLNLKDFNIPVFLSLNYLNVATEISLIGNPCAGNDCNDPFFEHHTYTYYSLLQNQYPGCQS